ncbi:MAG: DUF4230 domain-containing protein [Planctomycetota bacterium]
MELIWIGFVSAAFVVGGALAFLIARQVFKTAAPQRDSIDTIVERVRAVGRLVGLEVAAKEIATATKGWSWLPPLLLSQARVAMIFAFEKQYSVDLARLTAGDVIKRGEGSFVLRMPPVHGSLRLTDVTPYDIQDGRVLGLLDVIQMNAQTQHQLMRKAQEQATELFTKNDARYLAETRSSVERQLRALLALFEVEVTIEWPDDQEETGEMVAVGEAAKALPSAAAN